MRARTIVALTLAAGAAAAPSAAASTIRQHRVPTINAGPFYIAAGAQNDLWFSENRVPKVGRITTRGVITEYRLGSCRQPGRIAARDRDVWVACLGKVKRLRVAYRRNRRPSVRISETRLPAGRLIVDLETARDGSLWYIAIPEAGDQNSDGIYYGRITQSGGIQERHDSPRITGDPSVAITPAGEVWISNGSASFAANESWPAYLSRIDENLEVVERVVVPDAPQAALTKGTNVGGVLATNSNSLLFPLGWYTSQPDTSIRLFGEMTSARQIRVSPSITPVDSGRLFRGRGNAAWLVYRGGPALNVFVRLKDDGSVARQYGAVALKGRDIIDAAQGADGRFWVTQTRSNFIGRVTLTR